MRRFSHFLALCVFWTCFGVGVQSVLRDWAGLYVLGVKCVLDVFGLVRLNVLTMLRLIS